MNELPHTVFAPAVSTELLGRIGEVVAASATQLQGAAGADELARGLARLEALGVQLQQAARVLAAPAGERPERIGLGVAALQACSEWAHTFEEAGLTWVGPQHDCRVVVNPAVLKQMIDLAFGHAVGLGRRVEIDLDARESPPQSLLRIFIERRSGELFAAQPGEAAEWHWALLALLARHAGIVAERDVRATAVVISLAFESFAGLGPIAPVADDALPESHVPPGCRVLLLEPHEATRVTAERLMLGAGVKVTAVATVDAARGALAGGLPDGLVTGIDMQDPACAVFVEDLQARRPGLRLIELTAQPHVFATSLPEAGRPARVARADVERCLVTALAQELSAPR